MNRYGIKSVFDTLQGEGGRAGARSVFVRFSGCNLWDGNPLHRDVGVGPCAKWCDTDFRKGVMMDLDALLAAMNELWPRTDGVQRWAVLTGGEPLLQVDHNLINALHADGWAVALETNGTIATDIAFDLVSVSPKRGTTLKITRATEVKVVLPGSVAPGDGWTHDELVALESTIRAQRYFVQPQDAMLDDGGIGNTALLHDPETADHSLAQFATARYTQAVAQCFEFVRARPKWRVSLQLNKYIGLP